jgi:hypothetical protein
MEGVEHQVAGLGAPPPRAAPEPTDRLCEARRPAKAARVRLCGMASQPGGRSLGSRRMINRLNHRPAPCQASKGNRRLMARSEGAAAEAFGGVSDLHCLLQWGSAPAEQGAIGTEGLPSCGAELLLIECGGRQQAVDCWQRRFKAGKGDRECRNLKALCNSLRGCAINKKASLKREA